MFIDNGQYTKSNPPDSHGTIDVTANKRGVTSFTQDWVELSLALQILIPNSIGFVLVTSILHHDSWFHSGQIPRILASTEMPGIEVRQTPGIEVTQMPGTKIRCPKVTKKILEMPGIEASQTPGIQPESSRSCTWLQLLVDQVHSTCLPTTLIQILHLSGTCPNENLHSWTTFIFSSE